MTKKSLFLCLIMIISSCFGCSRTEIISTSTKDDFNLSISEKEALLQKAFKGDANACFRLANYYMFVEKDDKQMLLWLERAAEFGNVIAQYNLAFYILESKNETDHQQAIIWFSKSAENGHIDSHVRLAEIFERGDIIKKDLSVAKEWYEKASLMGNTVAIEKLSDFYLEGKGCDYDKIKAYALLSFAELLINNKSVRFKEIVIKIRTIEISEDEKKQAKIELDILKEKYNKYLAKLQMVHD